MDTRKITFLNDNAEKNLVDAAIIHLEDRRDDFDTFSRSEDMETEDLGSFYDYGLCFDVVEDEETGEVSYWRYQLSWGGPSEEIRFHVDGTTEFVYLDWFCGVGFDVTDDDVFEWLREWFDDAGMLEVPVER